MPLVGSKFFSIIGLLIFFCTSTALGAIEVDNTSSTNAIAPVGNYLSWHHTVLSGSSRILVVSVSLRRRTNDETVSSVHYGDEQLIFIGAAKSTDKNNKYRAELWYLLAPPLGTNNISVQFSGEVESTAAGAVSFTGVDQNTPLGAFAEAGGNDGIPSVSVSSAADEIIIDTIAIKGKNDNVITPGFGQTQLWIDQTGNTENSDIIGAASKKIGAASTTMSYNVVSEEQWALVAVPIKPISIEPIYQPDAMIKLASEDAIDYLTNDIYESNATVQFKSLGVINGTPAIYHVRFQNDGNVADKLVIKGTPSGFGFTVQYLDSTGEDRTADVTGAGYTIFGIAVGADTTWNVNVTPNSAPNPVDGGTSFTVLVTSNSAIDITKIDQVKAVTSSTSANLTLIKTSDKTNAAPGEDITYTVSTSNGSGLTDAKTVVITEPLDINTMFKMGGATFNTGSSTLSFTIAFSNDYGSSFIYTPESEGCGAPVGYDGCVTRVKWVGAGSMPADTNFSVELVVRVK